MPSGSARCFLTYAALWAYPSRTLENTIFSLFLDIPAFQPISAISLSYSFIIANPKEFVKGKRVGADYAPIWDRPPTLFKQDLSAPADGPR